MLWSWAVPKGPSADPEVKRYAVRTEDHPLAYADFEGVIPKGEYGGGTVLVWDRGTWSPVEDPEGALAKGHLAFDLHGERLVGRWHLVRLARPEEGREGWLLFKGRDAGATAEVDLTEAFRDSVLSGRDLEAVAAAPARVWRSGAPEEGGGEEVPGAVAGPLPAFVPPMLARLAEAPPEGEGWLHEIKLDGYRIQLRLDRQEVRALTRKGLDWTDRVGRVAEAAAVLPAREALVDGELVVFDREGRSDFGRLQEALSAGDQGVLRYVAFDLLHLDGQDLRGVALERRKDLLRRLLVGADPVLRGSEHLRGEGPLFFDQARRLGLEGIVSKRPDGRYRSGRQDAWRKVKAVHRQDFVVVGFTESEAGGIGALYLAGWDAGVLRPAGRVGTGFSDAERRGFLEALARLRCDPCPVTFAPQAQDDLRDVRWITPRLVAEVGFAGWTRQGRLRHPTFLGLREDIDPREVSMRPEIATAPLTPPPEAEEVLARVRVTHPERVYWPDLGVTKAELLAYWATVAPRALPELAGRPLTLVRCPQGIEGQRFTQKHHRPGFPEWIRSLRVKGEGARHLFVEGLEGLLALAQHSALELHPWGSTAADPDHPDRIIFDLDPPEDTAWGRIAEAAWRVREHLEELGLQSFVRTTGGKGLHVVVPLQPAAGWSAVRAFAEGVTRRVAARWPDRYTVSHGLAGRRGRIYLDILRNSRGATAVGTWSPRARPGAPVAVPVAWEEIAGLGGGDAWSIRTAPSRLGQPDPWAGWNALVQRIDAEVGTG